MMGTEGCWMVLDGAGFTLEGVDREAPLWMISGWSGPMWLVALYDLFDEDCVLFVWIVLCLL